MEVGETLVEAVAREALEETGRRFTPEGFLGMYMSRFRRTRTGEDITYLRLAFFGSVSEADPLLELDDGSLVPVPFVVSCEAGITVIDPPEGLFGLDDRADGIG